MIYWQYLADIYIYIYIYMVYARKAQLEAPGEDRAETMVEN